MSKEQEDRARKARLTITIVAALFLLPILASWFLVFFTDYKPGSGGTEHGILIQPARQLQDVMLTDPITGKKHGLHDKWTLLSPVLGDCKEQCQNNIYSMRQIRLAMGKEMQRVQRVTFFSNKSYLENTEELFADYPGHQVLFAPASQQDIGKLLAVEAVDTNNAIYVVDPAGFLVICYPQDTDPSGIIKDMKRLLRISKLD